jgi:hypothetical protein
VSIAGNRNNTAIVCEDPAFTRSAPKAKWRDWMTQKQRHLSTGKYYKTPVKLILGTYGLSHAVMWLALFVLFFSGSLMLVLLIMGARCLLYWVIWAVTASKLKEKKLCYLFPLLDIGWMVYNFAFLPYIAWKNKKNWT